ncbi:hypothetical protein [Desmospora activa]|uniref:Uncharacterized protein n=1 Tax=Desmospora activa DSM 45169 TaxID=1121389 RepID=A0A2T4ZB65_9BACL|nr:hypothetical protein [Desmospora activa]PTM59115.1 hypothetical protein C8J48_1717 [Desmospora activa DSM 45169]
MGNPNLYRELAQTVNRSLGRQAITTTLIEQTVAEAKKVRRLRGTWGLVKFLEGRMDRLFSSHEMEKLKLHPRRRELSYRMLDHLVAEGVMSPTESLMLKRMVP